MGVTMGKTEVTSMGAILTKLYSDQALLAGKSMGREAWESAGTGMVRADGDNFYCSLFLFPLVFTFGLFVITFPSLIYPSLHLSRISFSSWLFSWLISSSSLLFLPLSGQKCMWCLSFLLFPSSKEVKLSMSHIWLSKSRSISFTPHALLLMAGFLPPTPPDN